MLLQLRMDVEDLKRGFEDYRERHADLGVPAIPFPFQPGIIGREVSVPAGAGVGGGLAGFGGLDENDDELDAERTVVYRPGMTMRDLEKEAITAALKEVGGNRREAAEILGISYKALLYKIKEAELDKAS